MGEGTVSILMGELNADSTGILFYFLILAFSRAESLGI